MTSSKVILKKIQSICLSVCLPIHATLAQLPCFLHTVQTMCFVSCLGKYYNKGFLLPERNWQNAPHLVFRCKVSAMGFISIIIPIPIVFPAQ